MGSNPSRLAGGMRNMRSIFGRRNIAITFSAGKAFSNCPQALRKSLSDATIEGVVFQDVCQSITKRLLRQNSMIQQIELET